MPDYPCPFCASRATASRRSLFLALVRERALPPKFDWYGQQVPGSYPPRSLAVILGLWLLGLSVPALLLWYFDAASAVQVVMIFAALMVMALALDLLITLGDYRNWARERVCALCRGIYRVSASLNA